MKKTYVKPELDVIEFDLGEAIAASQCVAQMYNHAKENCERLTRRLLKNVRKLLHSTRIFRLPKRSAAIFRRSVYAVVRELRRFGSHTTGSFDPAE